MLGCGAPSARKFLKPDEMTLTVPMPLYEQLLTRWPEAFLATKTWAGVQKKNARSREVWKKEG